MGPSCPRFRESIKVSLVLSVRYGGLVAQRLEQRTHNPLVLGSNPSGPTNKFLSPDFAISWFSRFAHFPQIREHLRTKLPRPAPQRGFASPGITQPKSGWCG